MAFALSVVGFTQSRSMLYSSHVSSFLNKSVFISIALHTASYSLDTKSLSFRSWSSTVPIVTQMMASERCFELPYFVKVFLEYGGYIRQSVEAFCKPVVSGVSASNY